MLRSPGAWRVVLLHGDDAGLIRERAEALRAVVVGSDDPFRVVEISREALQRDPGLLAAEASAAALTGGRRWLRVRDSTDAIAPAVEAALAQPADALVVIEAPDLPGRSRLRALLDPAPEAAVIACWRERGEALAASLEGMLREAGVRADPSALGWLATRLDGDREMLRREVEKIVLYAGAGGIADEATMLALAPDDSSLELDDALLAATAGDVARADRALDAALGEGAVPVQVLRAAQRHLQRLQLAVAGVAPDALRPPVFFRHRTAFDRAVRLWSAERLARAAEGLGQAERRAKSVSQARPVPDMAVARAAILALAHTAALLSRRSGGE